MFNRLCKPVLRMCNHELGVPYYQAQTSSVVVATKNYLQPDICCT